MVVNSKLVFVNKKFTINKCKILLKNLSYIGILFWYYLNFGISPYIFTIFYLKNMDRNLLAFLFYVLKLEKMFDVFCLNFKKRKGEEIWLQKKR